MPNSKMSSNEHPSSAYLSLMLTVGAENFLDTLSLLQQLGHGSVVVLHLDGPLLLGVEHLGQVVAQSQRHLKPSQVAVIPNNTAPSAIIEHSIYKHQMSLINHMNMCNQRPEKLAPMKICDKRLSLTISKDHILWGYHSQKRLETP